MTKRLHLTLDEVLDEVLSDDEDLADPDEPMMEGSDDEFSDLEMDDIDDCEMDTSELESHSQGIHSRGLPLQ